MKLSRNNRSFTLVETLITIAISTAVFAGIYSTYIVGNRAWRHYNDAIAVRREARRAMMGMTNELRAAENVRVVQGPDGSAIHFYDPVRGPVSFVWNRQGNDANRLTRHNRLAKRIMAQYISVVSFEHTKDSVLVTVMASKKTTKGEESRAVLREKVALRAKTAYFK